VNFDFDDDQQLLRESVRRFLDERYPLSVTREALEADAVLDRELWRRGAELGWTAMLIPEQHEGGSITSQPLVDLVVLAEELGRTLNPGPLVSTNVVADAIARFGLDEQRSTWLPRIARGEVIATWSLSAEGTPDLEAPGVDAVVSGGGVTLNGTARYVHEAVGAELVLATVRLDGKAACVLVPLPHDGVRVRRHTGLDLTRRFGEITFTGATVPADSVLGGAEVLERAISVATVIKSAEATGAAEILFERTVDYLRDRVQFGRTIGSYQAIKHRLADLLIEVEAMRTATYYAALAVDEGFEDAAEAVATAGSYVPEAFAHLTGESLQLHGGIGFTWEHDVHLFVRRSKSDEPLYGEPAWHRENLFEMLDAATLGESA